MNLIQQAVERAQQMEQRKPPSPTPARHPTYRLSGFNSSGFSTLDARPFRPVPLNRSRVPLGAVGLCLLAMIGGAMLYALVARATAGPSASAAPVARANALPEVAAPRAPVIAAETAPVVATSAAASVATALPATAAGVAAVATVTTVAPVTAATKVPTPTAAATAQEAAATLNQAQALIEQWAHAWSARDVQAYLGFYGQGFEPSGGVQRGDWEKARRQMIERRRSIEVSVKDLQLEAVSGDRIVARYVQDYTADAYRELGTRKRLVLQREGEAWRIVAEVSDAAPKAGAT